MSRSDDNPASSQDLGQLATRALLEGDWNWFETTAISICDHVWRTELVNSDASEEHALVARSIEIGELEARVLRAVERIHRNYARLAVANQQAANCLTLLTGALILQRGVRGGCTGLIVPYQSTSVCAVRSLVHLGGFALANQLIGDTEDLLDQCEVRELHGTPLGIFRAEVIVARAEVCVGMGAEETALALTNRARAELSTTAIEQFGESDAVAKQNLLSILFEICRLEWQAHSFNHRALGMNQRNLETHHLAHAIGSASQALRILDELGEKEDFAEQKAEMFAKRAASEYESGEGSWKDAEADAWNALVLVSDRAAAGDIVARGIRIECWSLLCSLESDRCPVDRKFIVSEARLLVAEEPFQLEILTVELGNWLAELDGAKITDSVVNEALKEFCETARQLCDSLQGGDSGRQMRMLIDGLRQLGRSFFLLGEYGMAASALLEASHHKERSRPFLNPLWHAESNLETDIPDLLTLSLQRQDISPLVSLGASERHKARALHDFARLKYDTVVLNHDLLRKYSDALGEYLVSVAGRPALPHMNDKFESQWARVVYRQPHWREECTQLFGQIRSLGMDPRFSSLNGEQVRHLAILSQRTIIDLRLTSFGTSIHVVKPSGEVSTGFAEDASLSRLISLLGLEGQDGQGGWLFHRDEATLRSSKQANSSWEKSTERLLKAVEQLLMGEIRPMVEDLPLGSTITIVPDKLLSMIPFHACLWDGKGGREEYWGDRFALTYVPSSSILQIAHNYSKVFGIQPRVSVFAIPNSPALSALGLPALPFSGFEAAALDALFGEGCTLTCGADAESGQFDRIGNDVGVLHLGLHSVLNMENPLLSWIAFYSSLLTGGQLARSWMIGVNHVVLSACDTGPIDIRAFNNDCFSLSAAFLAAGVPSIWATLWRVDDAAIAFTMARAHELKREGCEGRDALRKSQKWLRNLSGEEARDFALPVLDLIRSDHERYGLDVHGVANLDYHIGRLASKDRPFENPVYWAAAQHIGI